MFTSGWNLLRKERDAGKDTGGTPKGSAGPACSQRGSLDGGDACVGRLDGLCTGLGGAQPEVHRHDTGSNNESGFEHGFPAEEPRARSRPNRAKRCPWRVGEIGGRAHGVRFTLGDGMQQACKPRLLAVFVDVRRERPHGSAPKTVRSCPRTPSWTGRTWRPPWATAIGRRHLIVPPFPGCRPPSQETVSTRNV